MFSLITNETCFTVTCVYIRRYITRIIIIIIIIRKFFLSAFLTSMRFTRILFKIWKSKYSKNKVIDILNHDRNMFILILRLLRSIKPDETR